jgi:hypothetical protein
MIKNLFKDTTPSIRFAAIHGAYNYSPVARIKLASDLSNQPDWLKKQKNYENSRDKFLNCPGMADYLKAGYIIPAWGNIKIKANRADTITIVDSHNPIVTPMNYKLVDGLVPIESSVKPKVTKIVAPWAIFTKPGYSAYLLPAIYHSPFLKDLYVYSGIVDYDDFTVCNFLFTALRECEIEIPVGTPLLQVIPFKREDITAVSMRGSIVDQEKSAFHFPQKLKAAYRKFCHKRKKYTLIHKEEQDN